MKISQIIQNRSVITIAPSATIQELTQLLTTHKIGAVVVSSNSKIVEGIISERDVVRALPTYGSSLSAMKVSEIMTKDVITCTEDNKVADLMGEMTKSRIRHLPVVNENNELNGIISIGDLVKAHIEDIDSERNALAEYVKSSVS
jgi:CBS domain-containing protein